MTDTRNSGTSTSGQESGRDTDGGFRSGNLTDYRSLRRTRVDRKIAGVAGGLGRHLGLDPTILRVVFVVLLFFGGAGLVLYAVGWLVVPEEDTGQSVVETSDSTRNALLIGAAVLAALLVATGEWHGFGILWLALIGIVLVLAFGNTGGRSATPPTEPSVPHPDAQQPSGASLGGWQPPVYTAGITPQSGPGEPPPPSWYPPAGPAPSPPPQTRRHRGPLLFGPALALATLGLGVLGLYDATGGEVPPTAYPALVLGVAGAMLVLGALFGRPGGLIGLGIAGLAVTTAIGFGEPTFSGERNQEIRPLTAAQLEDEYRVPAGRIEVDLRDVSDLEALDGRTVEVTGNAGELVVVVPRDLYVTVSSEIDYGGVIDIENTSIGGWGVDRNTEVGDRRGADAELDLVLRLRTGHIEVRRG